MRLMNVKLREPRGQGRLQEGFLMAMSLSSYSIRLAAALVTAATMGCSGAEDQSTATRSPDDLDAGVSRNDAGGRDVDAMVPRRICDGSSAIRFAFSFAVDRFADSASVLYDLGSDYLYVDGTCHYWLDQPTDVVDEYRSWRPVREGVLTAEQEGALYGAVGYDDFSQAPPCPTAAPAGDVSVARMWDGERVHSCVGGLEAPPGWPMRAELYSSALPVHGPLRIKVSVVPVTVNDLTYEWPLDDPIANYLADGLDESFRIDDDAAVEALTRLRERLIADATQKPGYYRGHIGILPVDDVLVPGQGYALAMRDDLPFTNGNGRWSPP
jgi:hypothetical protein